jgi:hypothetical protein
MKTPHKHAELIKAWADGAEIEFYDTRFATNRWKLCGDTPVWDEKFQYRIKPKPDIIYYGVFNPRQICNHPLEADACFTKFNDVDDQIKVTFDGETGKLKSAEVL